MRIVYIDIDALRPDHLGCYGYHRNTSPNINALAASSSRFSNYYCSDAPCLPSRTALYSGMFGIHTGVVGHDGTAADLFHEGPARGFKDRLDRFSLPAVLQRGGFHTAQISPFGQRHSARQFYAGFNEIHNTGKGGTESAEEVTPLVMKWLGEKATADHWFLHLNYWDPHTPYRVPLEYGEPFADDPLPEWLTEEVWQEHLHKVGPHGAQEISMWDDREDSRFPRHPGSVRTRRDLRRMINGYDTAIRYVDDQIGRIVAQLQEAGVYDDTAIIISADHGENLGELGLYGEHATADHITCRVPLLIKWPGKNGGGVNRGLHYNLDLAPTIADLLGLEAPEMWDGQSFAPALGGNGADEAGRESLVLSQCAHVCQRSVRMGPWLYMRTYHDGFHLFPREMLFNIEEDPHEQHDRAEERPEICCDAAARLLQWHDEMMASSITDVDPLWTVIREGGPCHARGKLKEYLGYVEKTGRGWAIEQLKQRHPGELDF